MTTTQIDIQLPQQAIRQLPRKERDDLADWIFGSSDVEFGVAEAALPYGGRRYFTVEEYLQFEEECPDRHEYVRGYVFAMSRPVLRHQVLVANVIWHFQNQLRGTPCRVFPSDTKVRLKVDQDDIFYSPDVVIACGSLTEELLDAKWLTNPCVVVEVISRGIPGDRAALNGSHRLSTKQQLAAARSDGIGGRVRIPRRKCEREAREHLRGSSTEATRVCTPAAAHHRAWPN